MSIKAVTVFKPFPIGLIVISFCAYNEEFLDSIKSMTELHINDDEEEFLVA